MFVNVSSAPQVLVTNWLLCLFGKPNRSFLMPKHVFTVLVKLLVNLSLHIIMAALTTHFMFISFLAWNMLKVRFEFQPIKLSVNILFPHLEKITSAYYTETPIIIQIIKNYCYIYIQTFQKLLLPYHKSPYPVSNTWSDLLWPSGIWEQLNIAVITVQFWLARKFILSLSIFSWYEI